MTETSQHGTNFETQYEYIQDFVKIIQQNLKQIEKMKEEKTYPSQQFNEMYSIIANDLRQINFDVNQLKEILEEEKKNLQEEDFTKFCKQIGTLQEEIKKFGLQFQDYKHLYDTTLDMNEEEYADEIEDDLYLIPKGDDHKQIRKWNPIILFCILTIFGVFILFVIAILLWLIIK